MVETGILKLKRVFKVIKFCPLASGSKGNASFLETEDTKILIDAGIGLKDLEKRLEKIDAKIEDIDALLITHEHKDHIEGLKTISSKKEDILIFSNLETAKGIYQYIQKSLKFKIFTTNELFEFKNLKIFPFSIPHDAIEPVGFVFNIKEIKFGFLSDAGFVTTLLTKNLKDCDFLYIESNYDKDLLKNSKRPLLLKKRIMGRQGHLSNEECKKLIESIYHPNLKHIFLSHISSECNKEELARKSLEKLFEEKKIKPKISIAYQDKVSDLLLF